MLLSPMKACAPSGVSASSASACPMSLAWPPVSTKSRGLPKVTVESISTACKSGRCEHPECSTCQTPRRHQREKRLNTEFHLPCSAGSKRPIAPPTAEPTAPPSGRSAMRFGSHPDMLIGGQDRVDRLLFFVANFDPVRHLEIALTLAAGRCHVNKT